MNNLARQRLMVIKHFSAAARQQGLKINPNTDERTLNLVDRLYEEDREGRAIRIGLRSPDNLYTFDHFFKVKEWDDQQADLLVIAVTRAGPVLDKLWSMYRMWMHEGRSRADVEAAFPREKAGPSN